MARKRGKQSDSRTALLDAAWQLLLERRAPEMSIDSIVARADLSKGTFFHFFPTKQAFLDALCARIAEESWQQTGTMLDRSDLGPLARLDLFLQSSRSWRSDRSMAVGQLWRELARDENAPLMNKVRSLGIERLAPAMARLLVEANDLGQMHVEDVEVVARLAVEWIFVSAEGSMRLLAVPRDEDAVTLAMRRANATLEAFERVLGAAQGSLRRVDKDVVDKLAADVTKLDDTDPDDPVEHRTTASDSRQARRGGDGHGSPSKDHV